MGNKYIVIHVDKEDYWVHFLIIDTLENCLQFIQNPQILENVFGNASYEVIDNNVVSAFSELRIMNLDGIPDIESYDF